MRVAAATAKYGVNRVAAALTVAALAVAAVIGVVAQLLPEDEPADPPLVAAAHYCFTDPIGSGVSLSDRGHTMLIDGADDEGRGGTRVSGIVCILNQLDAPTAVVARMEGTRALDGMQDATWGGLTASWTYHPDDGLDIIITGG